KEANAWKRLLQTMLILPIVNLYYEMLFRIVTGREFVGFKIIPIALFCLIYGIIGYLLSSIARRRDVNHWIKFGLMAASAVPYLVEYFIYRQFKVFYDVETILNAFVDVVTSNFMGDAVRLVFSLSGLFVILLFFLPAIGYAIFWKKIDPCRSATLKTRIIALLLLAATIILTFLVVAIPKANRETYKSKYQFESAVNQFGLKTGLRLEIRKAIFGETVDFDEFDTEDEKDKDKDKDKEKTTKKTDGESTTESTTETTTEEPTTYGTNELEIDFEALAEKADDKTLKNMDLYVASLTPSSQNEYTGLFKGKNLIFISGEAFSAEAIDKDRTPTLYRMATKGINFTDYYQPASAGTTGGEVENIFGFLPLKGGSTFTQLAKHHNYYTISWQLNKLGYWGQAYHNNSYTYYHRDETHTKLGFSEGYMGYGNGMEEYVKKQWPESDLEMMEGTVDKYINQDKFSVYYMSVSGHSQYSWAGNAMSKKNRESVAALEAEGKLSEPVLAYLACNVELDKAMEYLIKRLEEAGKADDTVIVISADHFPYGLDADAPIGKQPYLSELYGYAPTNLIERDHNRLILWCGSLEKSAPIVVDTPTSSLDVLPTLMNLFGIEYDSRLCIGRDVFSDAEPIMFNTAYDWKTDKGTYIASSGTFTPVDGVTVEDDYVKRISKIVSNKMTFNKGLINYDYFKHVFGSDY
ncbi:MAG: sulfatase-like hydrolase/transferase, partial [Lachnospiraceae bacterium]|nr:sulfatase-like hydrolase/transferase [Lachnospiraceae bacterium]